MARAIKKDIAQSEYVRSDNPIIEAMALHDKYKIKHGASVLLDAAVRVVHHWAKNEVAEQSIPHARAMEIYEASGKLETILLSVAREENTKEAMQKYRLVSDIRNHLLDCLGE